MSAEDIKMGAIIAFERIITKFRNSMTLHDFCLLREEEQEVLRKIDGIITDEKKTACGSSLSQSTQAQWPQHYNTIPYEVALPKSSSPRLVSNTGKQPMEWCRDY